MKSHNIGFSGKNWIRLMESSSDYKALAKAIDSDNQLAMVQMYHSVFALYNSNAESARQHARYSLEASNTLENTKKHDIMCPFCKGSGNLDIEYSPRSNPDITKKISARCAACKGTGKINISEFFSDYMGDFYPENVIISILNGNLPEAKKHSDEIINFIKAMYPKIEEISLDSELRR